MRFLFFFLLHAICLQGYSQTFTEKYDLNFEDFNDCRWQWSVGKIYTTLSIDSTISVEGKYPINASYRYYEDLKDAKMKFALSRTIILPDYQQGENCAISINEKNTNIENLFFVVTSFDEDQNIVFEDSITLNNLDWDLKTISFNLTKERAVRINLNYYGDSKLTQGIWLDRVSIAIGGKDIGEQDINVISEKKETQLRESLDKRHLIPLSTSDDESFTPILEAIKDKKIIGLGECTHGSQEIKESAYQFIKVLIKESNVRLIAFERPMDMLSKYNLYIQGNTNEEYINKIEEELRCFFDNYESFIELLIWLRNYNQTEGSKVNFVGIDPITDPILSMSQYHLAVQNEDQAIPYLKVFQEEDYLGASAMAEVDDPFQKIIGEKCFRYYNYLLENCVPRSSIIGYVDNTFTRDLKMAENVRKAMNIFLQGNEKVIVFAHSGHLTTIPEIEDYPYTRIKAGCYLRDWYGKSYFPISFQIGVGEYTEDECTVFDPQTTNSLPKPIVQSFANAAMNTGSDYFYYPSVHLGKEIIAINNIPRENRYKSPERFASPHKLFDAYVFIRKSSPLKKIDEDPLGYTYDYIRKKSAELKLYLKNTSNSNQIN